MSSQLRWILPLVSSIACGCAPGDDSTGGIASAVTTGPVNALPPFQATDNTLQQRKNAATKTANTEPLCTAIYPFYWEIGDVNGALVSGSAGDDTYNSGTKMIYASASKMLFGGYAVQAGGPPLAELVPYFNFTSGYMNFSSDICYGPTVDDCLKGASGAQTQKEIGRFYYNGAHLEKLASIMGLGNDTAADLTTDVLAQIGTDVAIDYYMPQPAGGAQGTPAAYATYLRKLLKNSTEPLALGEVLDTNMVCTNPATCPTADYSPIPGDHGNDESWSYGLAHWIENDPDVGDGLFSSPGSYGFYPWVDKSRVLYGTLARQTTTGGQGYASAECGRLIRKAFVNGTVE